MSHHTLRVDVDVTNPGEYFACCGLLELAHRLWPSAEGWFEPGTFCLGCCSDAMSIGTIINRLLALPELSKSVNWRQRIGKSKLQPLTLEFPESTLVIDWWRNELKPPGKGSRESCSASEFKTWAGNQSPQQIVYDRLLPAIEKIRAGVDETKWFRAREPLTGRFGFDYSASPEKLDAGWSPDALNIKVGSMPVVELLAMIGLQRFRPSRLKSRQYRYAPWTVRATASVAALLSSGSIPSLAPLRYQFNLLERGDYLFFSRAYLKGAQS